MVPSSTRIEEIQLRLCPMDRATPVLASRGCDLKRIGLLLMVVWLGFNGCTTTAPEVIPPSFTQKELIGKTRQELMVCAAVQPEERTVGELTVLKYYKEASILEESFPASKGSVARVHHGCWATLGLKHDRVEGVQYDSVPSPSKHEGHCDEIFQNCVGSEGEPTKTIPP